MLTTVTPDAQEFNIRDGDHRDFDQPAHHAGESAFHPGDHDDDARRPQHVGLRQETMDAGDPDVGETLDAILQRPGGDRRFLGHRKIARAGRAHEHRAATSGRRFGVGRQVCRPAQLIDFDSGKAGGECLCLRAVGAGCEEAATRHLEPFGDGDDLAGRLARTKNHLLMPLGDGPEVIDRRERQLLELHAAMSAGRAR